MKRNLLRSRDSHSEERVGFIELFFDLVFVFAVTQVSHAIILHPDPLGFVQAGLLFLAIWWVWVDTAWVTNWLDVRHMPVRLLLFALMGAALVMSISLPQAFGGRALPFALAYVGIQLGRHVFMLLALVRHNRDNFLNFVRITLWSLAEAPFWIAGALAQDVAMRMALWGVALAIVSTGPVVAFWMPGLGRSETRTWDVEGHHFSERCGLFIIIALGESILVTGAAFGQTDWTRAGHRRLRQRLRRHDRHVVALFRHRRRARRARLCAGQGSGPDGAARLHLFPHPDRRRDHRHRRLGRDGGGPSRRPGGHRGGRRSARRAGALSVRQSASSSGPAPTIIPLSHMAGLGLLALAAPFAAALSPLALSLAATAVLVLVAGWELLSLRETPQALKA